MKFSVFENVKAVELADEKVGNGFVNLKLIFAENNVSSSQP